MVKEKKQYVHKASSLRKKNTSEENVENANDNRIQSIQDRLNKGGWRASRERLRHGIPPLSVDKICPQDHRHIEFQLNLGVELDQPDKELRNKFQEKFGQN